MWTRYEDPTLEMLILFLRPRFNDLYLHYKLNDEYFNVSTARKQKVDMKILFYWKRVGYQIEIYKLTT